MVTKATSELWIFSLEIIYGQNCPNMHIFVSIRACNTNKKKTAYGKEKNGEKPKILITESVKIGNHATVFWLVISVIQPGKPVTMEVGRLLVVVLAEKCVQMEIISSKSIWIFNPTI